MLLVSILLCVPFFMNSVTCFSRGSVFSFVSDSTPDGPDCPGLSLWKKFTLNFEKKIFPENISGKTEYIALVF